MSTCAQPGRLRRPGRGLGSKKFKPQPLHLSQGAACSKERSRLSRDGAPSDVSRYEGWMQYAAAPGNGIASYDLTLHYRRTEQPLLASQFEARARELGYTPPPSLDNTRK